MNGIPNRNDWNFLDFYNKEEEYNFTRLVNYYISYMFSRTLKMFEWKNLPDGMKSFEFEKFTQLKGASFLLYDAAKKRHFILEGSYYDNITWNYEPSKSLIVNPALPEISSKKYELGKDAVMLRNDYLLLGLWPMLEKNSMDVANTDISIRYAQFNTRLKSIFTSNDDNTKESLNTLLEDIWVGKKPSAIVTDDLYKSSIEGVKYADNSQNDIKSLIELKQYQLANFYIELCINANYNMKREAINENEANMNEDALLPLIDQMLECRKDFCNEVNTLYGLNIDVDLSSSWKKIRREVEESLKKDEAETDILENEANNPIEPKEENTVDNTGGDKDEN